MAQMMADEDGIDVADQGTRHLGHELNPALAAERLKMTLKQAWQSDFQFGNPIRLLPAVAARKFPDCDQFAT